MIPTLIACAGAAQRTQGAGTGNASAGRAPHLMMHTPEHDIPTWQVAKIGTHAQAQAQAQAPTWAA